MTIKNFSSHPECSVSETEGSHIFYISGELQVNYVYILTNKYNTTMYVGVTNNLERRISEHRQELIEGFTKKYHIHKLVYYEFYNNIKDAIIREKQIKGWRRDKKNNLVETLNPEWNDLYDEINTE